MKTHLVLELEDNVDPVSAARVFSTAPRVVSVMSVVDGQEMEIWRSGVHVASQRSHPMVQRAQRALDLAIEAAAKGTGA